MESLGGVLVDTGKMLERETFACVGYSILTMHTTDSFTLDPHTRRVLVVCIDHHLGNTVVMLPVLVALAKHFEQGVDVLVDDRYAVLIDALPETSKINRIRKYPAQRDGQFRKQKPWMSIARTLMAIAVYRYGVVINLSGGKWATAATGVSMARHRIGFLDTHWPWVFNRKMNRPLQRSDGPHALVRYAAALSSVGADLKAWPSPVSLEVASSSTAVPSASESKLDCAFASVEGIVDAQGGQDWVVLHPFAGKSWRLWPLKRFAQVARRLIDEQGLRVVVVGAAGDRSQGLSLVNAIDRPGHVCFLHLPLDALLVLFRRAALLVSNESGPTHLAAATSISIVTIFGPTVEAVWHPLRSSRLTVLRGAACDPKCRGASRCASNRQCLMELSVDTVVEAALAALSSPPKVGEVKIHPLGLKRFMALSMPSVSQRSMQSQARSKPGSSRSRWSGEKRPKT